MAWLAHPWPTYRRRTRGRCRACEDASPGFHLVNPVEPYAMPSLEYDWSFSDSYSPLWPFWQRKRVMVRVVMAVPPALTMPCARQSQTNLRLTVLALHPAHWTNGSFRRPRARQQGHRGPEAQVQGAAHEIEARRTCEVQGGIQLLSADVINQTRSPVVSMAQSGSRQRPSSPGSRSRPLF